MRYTLFTFLLLACIACSQDIEIEMPAYNAKVVVDGWIETGQPAKIMLTNSSAYFSTYDSATIRNLFINNAKITLECNDGISEILTLFRDDNYFPPFVYRSIKIKGEENKEYTLKIESRGRIITATTSIPEKPIIDKVEMKFKTDTTTTINATIKNSLGQTCFYYNEIKAINFDTHFHASTSPLMNNSKQTDEYFTYQVKRSNQPDPLNIFNIDTERNIPRTEFYYTDTVFVKISKIDEESHDIFANILLDELNYGNPFALVNQQTKSNINGGIGRWTGMASKTYRVYIHK